MTSQCYQWNGRSIAVAIAAFLIFAINGATCYTFGIFLPELVDGLQVTEKAGTLVGSLQAGLMMGFGIIVGGLTDKLDCNVVSLTGSSLVGCGYILSAFAPNINYLYVTIGVMSGIGLSLQFIPVSVAIQKIFPASQRNAVTGLTSSGSGIGIFLFAPVVRLLIDSYGWRASYALIGAFNLNGIGLAVLLRTKLPNGFKPRGDLRLKDDSDNLDTADAKEAQDASTEDNDVTCTDFHNDSNSLTIKTKCNQTRSHMRIFLTYIKDLFEFSALWNVTYILYLLAMFLFGFGSAIPYAFLPSKALSDGVSAFRASLLISFIGLADTVGRILAGFLALKIPSLIIMLGVLLVMASNAAFTPLMHSFQTLMIFAVLHGLAFGGSVTIQVTTGVDLLGVELLAKGIGTVFTSIAIASSVSMVLAAYLWEVFHLAEAPFLLASAGVYSASIIVVVLIIYHRRHPSRTQMLTPTIDIDT